MNFFNIIKSQIYKITWNVTKSRVVNLDRFEKEGLV